ncbi:tRNA(Met) cytidine acetyltransferase [Natronomonas halophila]|uniref:tRNA(Met) cytidine acetyltransferase TmcA n=1 Tax=Natronomonas halophila TaxID=2747817 RepID=UPI0015B6FB2D|nr:tRNA(Met) cytidine acetyltransferase TmcA [Natronomonas halophila]QLD84336.1 tRNA(Met) cytidine acetyltransferase [Natronomonas halophila]
MDAVRETARSLRAEAEATNERRLVVLAGAREAGYAAAEAVCEAVDCKPVVLSEREGIGVSARTIRPKQADQLLGTTNDCVVVDCHDACRPNAIGRAAGAVDGGGLLVLLTPLLDEWPDRRDGFDETLAVPPFGLDDVSGVFRRRLVDTLRAHRGIAIVDVGDGTVRDDGLTNPSPRFASEGFDIPEDAAFPRAVYERCLTADQRDAVEACENLREKGQAVVLEADRGRGKSSAAGLAAAALATEGRDVLVTAPSYRNTAELFERASETLDGLDCLAADAREGKGHPELRAEGEGRIRYRKPADAVEESADVLVVDEAAALSVRMLESLLSVAPSACFATTVHGYEGAGRGFDVRFRGRLDESHEVTLQRLSDPIRYAAPDPIETWLFRALLLDASPPADQLVADATPDSVAYERLDPAELVEDEPRLRETFGLLVNAHYRTEPDDLARLLDAPNIALRALTHGGHVVAVALLAREGGLSDETREDMYEGARVRGNMLPDVLTSQLRDIDAAVPVGLRVMRIATHHAVRSRGLGSHLLGAIEAEFDADGARSPLGRFDPVDYLGVGYGATPELLAFWATNDYATVHLSTTRNDTSGEYSALMLQPLSDAGEALTDRHTSWFCRRVPDVLADALDDADPDMVREALRAADGEAPLSLTDDEWRVVASAAYGPGLYDIAPSGFRQVALRALVDGALDAPTPERLLVRRVLQTWSWGETTDDLGYVSERECMRALGDAVQPLVDRYGNDIADAEADRYR